MSDESLQSCVLMPCSSTEAWAVPQICLAEILTLQTTAEAPPAEVEWRGVKVPVLDLGQDDGSVWRESRGSGSGLIAIFLGLKGEGCEYWGVAVRGDGIAVEKVSPQDIEDAQDQVLPHATAAFHFKGVLYQVPDLDKIQKKVTVGQHAA